jgi:hypothetical protein
VECLSSWVIASAPVSKGFAKRIKKGPRNLRKRGRRYEAVEVRYNHGAYECVVGRSCFDPGHGA